MADDRHFVGGDNYILDDIAGFKIRANKARVIPGGITGGLAVSPLRWEPQQPQDFVQGVRDDQTVQLSRPRQVNVFVITGTFVVAPSARGSSVIVVDSTVGFNPGSLIQIMLDSGENQQALVIGVTSTTLSIIPALDSSVGSLYGDPIENSVLLLTEGGGITGVFVLDTANGILGANFLA